MEHRDRHTVTKIEVLTVDHHLLGYVSTAGRRFSTWLNMSDSPTLTLDKVALRSLHDVGKSRTRRPLRPWRGMRSSGLWSTWRRRSTV
jgi:hypothetical protein